MGFRFTYGATNKRGVTAPALDVKRPGTGSLDYRFSVAYFEPEGIFFDPGDQGQSFRGKGQVFLPLTEWGWRRYKMHNGSPKKVTV